MDAGSTDTGDAETSTGPLSSRSWCIDADDDGFGNAEDCEDVRDDERPPAGSVQDDTDCDDGSARTFPGAATQEATTACTKDTDEDGWADAQPPAGVSAGSDCVDDDANTFPGAADLDDATACMRDADDDGYGDSMPPSGGSAGSDCNDNDEGIPSATECLSWCADEDEDQYGDPATCVIDVAAPDGYVGNAADCDDSSPDAFPGAAPLDDDMACMLDADGDDYGDSAPANAAITAGSDCDDLEVLVSDACFDCPMGTSLCNADDNITQCNATGTWGVEIESCSFGCDDVGAACWSALSVDAGTCAEMTDGGSAALTATPGGGDGNYTYAWSPISTLDDDDSATVNATPPVATTYAIALSDGEANAATDQVTVHITDQDWDLEAEGCSSHVFADIFDAPAQPPNDAFFVNGTAHCNLRNNGLANAYVCPAIMEQTQVSFDLEVANNADNDGIGFVWGWQDASHFYLLSWKQTTEAAPWGPWEEGITIKRIEADAPGDITGEDLAATYDTPAGTVLATPSDFLDQGWENQTQYRVFLALSGATTTITILDQDNGVMVATGGITDGTLGPGAVGSYDASQRTACTGAWRSSCL
ncbi:MAG: hypothetical protein KUG77_07410 [Nannocystaceae bacterium]|nr:hypothetical protein [Nannocystaceae bacterium]